MLLFKGSRIIDEAKGDLQRKIAISYQSFGHITDDSFYKEFLLHGHTFGLFCKKSFHWGVFAVASITGSGLDYIVGIGDDTVAVSGTLATNYSVLTAGFGQIGTNTFEGPFCIN